MACCDVVNRGLTYSDGTIVFNTLDNRTVALDADTGALLAGPACGSATAWWLVACAAAAPLLVNALLAGVWRHRSEPPLRGQSEERWPRGWAGSASRARSGSAW